MGFVVRASLRVEEAGFAVAAGLVVGVGAAVARRLPRPLVGRREAVAAAAVELVDGAVDEVGDFLVARGERLLVAVVFGRCGRVRLVGLRARCGELGAELLEVRLGGLKSGLGGLEVARVLGRGLRSFRFTSGMAGLGLDLGEFAFEFASACVGFEGGEQGVAF